MEIFIPGKDSLYIEIAPSLLHTSPSHMNLSTQPADSASPYATIVQTTVTMATHIWMKYNKYFWERRLYPLYLVYTSFVNCEAFVKDGYKSQTTCLFIKGNFLENFPAQMG